MGNEKYWDSLIREFEEMSDEDFLKTVKEVEEQKGKGGKMSLYNMVCGFNPACVWLLPMLEKKHTEYPRFRDCFLSEDGERIVIYTRVGGGNRNSGFGEEELYKDPNFAKTYDDDFDSTYGFYEFNVPDKWKDDFVKITSGKFNELSDEYTEKIVQFYPEIKDKILEICRG